MDIGKTLAELRTEREQVKEAIIFPERMARGAEGGVGHMRLDHGDEAARSSTRQQEQFQTQG